MTTASNMEITEQSASVVGWITLRALAILLGSTSPRSAKDWCDRHKITIVRDGGFNWVKIADVQAVIERLASIAKVTSLPKQVRDNVDPIAQAVALMRSR